MNYFKDALNKFRIKIKKVYEEYGNKKTMFFLSMFSLIIMISIGYWFGMLVGSKERVINGFEKAVIAKNKRAILKYVQLDSDIIKLNSKSIEPFMRYINDNPDSIKNKINILRYSSGENSKEIINLKSKKGIIGYKYKILISPVYADITTNLKDMEVFLDGKFYYKSDKDNYIKSIGPLVPGIYKVEGKLKTYNGQIKDLKSITFLEKKNKISIEPKISKISIDSINEEAQVFINGENTNKLVKEFKNIGPIPMDGSFKVYIQQQFPWGKINSEEIEIKDLSNIKLKINPVNDELKENLSSILKEFYYNGFQAVNKVNKSMMINSSDEIKNKFFDVYGDNRGVLKEEFFLKKLTIDESVIEVKEDKESYYISIVASIVYKKEKSFYGISLGTGEEKDRFINELVYEKKTKQWKIVSIEKA
ncbi:TcaA 3rd/4th domain-containing protein [Clostridium rectalis]|uniref:TcaA 3rd/4th domain-containing protein n=1 Tax=Clostridium rectalis TaxID=2040295 RepID=UPI000F643CFB|nr:hypothetical protein [Clostridium rectalis]